MSNMTETVQNTKKLYDYQERAMNQIMGKLAEVDDDYNILYQLPTGGGKTVIFSEIAKRYILEKGKKVLILTHRVELCRQTSRMLSEFGISNKVINSKVKELPDKDEYSCFVAMVETLNNRLQDEKFDLAGMGLVIIDEAHYNSFRKLYKYFDNCNMLGVTATPLSANAKLPMKNDFDELMVGESIPDLISKGFLAKADIYAYDVGLGMLKIGSNGDYTVRSSDLLYTSFHMLEKLLYAYRAKSNGKKTLIFNNGINTSKAVYDAFKEAGLEIRHLDNTATAQERREILDWFKVTPHAILTSVSILTTGFDEPTVESIILNRATKSLTLYHQMIGRGSRILKNKKRFTVIDLGNNAARFGPWDGFVNWGHIFTTPDIYIQNVVSDEEIERNFTFVLPEETKEKFPKTADFSFDIESSYKKAVAKGKPPRIVLEQSLDQHAQICIENSEDVYDALYLMPELEEDIADRIKRYARCIVKSTENYRKWLHENYTRQLSTKIRQDFD